MKTDAHLVQYSIFKPVLDTLQHTGVNTETLLARSSPGRFDLGNDENYVPVNLMHGQLYERDHG